jgi:hypothetical protein
MKYETIKSRYIDAVQYTGNNPDEVKEFLGNSFVRFDINRYPVENDLVIVKKSVVFITGSDDIRCGAVEGNYISNIGGVLFVYTAEKFEAKYKLCESTICVDPEPRFIPPPIMHKYFISVKLPNASNRINQYEWDTFEIPEGHDVTFALQNYIGMNMHKWDYCKPDIVAFNKL